MTGVGLDTADEGLSAAFVRLELRVLVAVDNRSSRSEARVELVPDEFDITSSSIQLIKFCCFPRVFIIHVAEIVPIVYLLPAAHLYS